MKLLSLAAIVAFACVLANGSRAQTAGPTWSPVNQLHVNVASPRQWTGPVRSTNCAWNGSACINAGSASGQWKTVDLTAAPWNVGANAKAVFLSGLLIITHGTTAETADIGVAFRAPGDNSVQCTIDHWAGQSVEAQIGGGQRSGMALWVPVVDGKIEYCWSGATPGTWPANSAYAVNLSVQAWAE